MNSQYAQGWKEYAEKNYFMHSVCVISAVLVGTAFDVLRHPLSFCSSFLQSLCLQCCRGHYPVFFASTSFMPLWLFSLCSISLFNTCSGPQISAVPLTVTVSLSPSCFLSLPWRLREKQKGEHFWKQSTQSWWQKWQQLIYNGTVKHWSRHISKLWTSYW